MLGIIPVFDIAFPPVKRRNTVKYEKTTIFPKKIDTGKSSLIYTIVFVSQLLFHITPLLSCLRLTELYFLKIIHPLYFQLNIQACF